MSNYVCVNGHDRCDQMYPGPDCSYCEKRMTDHEAKAIIQALTDARNEALEEAALWVIAKAKEHDTAETGGDEWDEASQDTAEHIAAAIRAMKEGE